VKTAGRPSHNLTAEQKKQNRHDRHIKAYKKKGCKFGKTYGEAWVEYLRILHIDDRIDNSVTLDDCHKYPPNLPKQMKPKEAIQYYKTKLQNVWDVLYPPKMSDFLKPDDYFDSFEAQRAVNNIILGMAI
jgi:hypothetical protein